MKINEQVINSISGMITAPLIAEIWTMSSEDYATLEILYTTMEHLKDNSAHAWHFMIFLHSLVGLKFPDVLRPIMKDEESSALFWPHFLADIEDCLLDYGPNID